MSILKDLTFILGRANRQVALTKCKEYKLVDVIGEENSKGNNKIFLGNNINLMKTLSKKEEYKGKLQLIYIDPPFFSKSDYDATLNLDDKMFKYKVYGDKWKFGLYEYLRQLSARLMLMRELLSDSGLIWVHLDWHVVHYVKILMDDIFGEKNFVNEIIWQYKSGGSTKKRFARKHDTILVYSKTKNYKFHPLEEKSYNRNLKPYRFKGVSEYKDDVGWYTMVNMKDVWQIDMVGRTSSERTGYATQKPEKLLERIIKSSTDEGDLCGDFFCGSGTMPLVAGRLNRKFIVCDESTLAVEGTLGRLGKAKINIEKYLEIERNKSDERYFDVTVEANLDDSDDFNENFLNISIIKVKEKYLSKKVDKNAKKLIEESMKDNGLSLISLWSIDYNHKDDIHRPSEIFKAENGKVSYSTGKFVNKNDDLCINIKVVDIMGNVCYKTVRLP